MGPPDSAIYTSSNRSIYPLYYGMHDRRPLNTLFGCIFAAFEGIWKALEYIQEYTLGASKC